MKKTIFIRILTVLALLSPGVALVKAQEAFTLAGVRVEDLRTGAGGGRKAQPIPPSPAAPAPQARKEWTVMVFMNAKNNLSQSQLFGLAGKWAVRDLDEMKKVGSTGKVNVVVEYGTTGKGSKRMQILKSGMLSSGEKIYGRYPNADMGDHKRVIEFARWAKANFPAKRYMFVLWNHGLGWLDPSVDGAASPGKGILFDDETNNYVRTRQLGEILRQSGYVDVFAMNACLMQMAEVAYEVKDGAGLIIASEETMLAQGFEYSKLLNFLNAEPRATNERISDFYIQSMRKFYADGAPLIGPINLSLDAIPATLSTLRPGALNRLPGYLDAFAGAVMRNGEIQAVKAAVAGVIRFTGPSSGDKKKLLAPYADLYDFARIVNAGAASPETRKAAADLMTFIKSDLVLRNFGVNFDRENGYDYSMVGGIAINMTMKAKLPPQLQAVLTGAFETSYSDLALSRASQWDEFVSWTDAVWYK